MEMLITSFNMFMSRHIKKNNVDIYKWIKENLKWHGQ